MARRILRAVLAAVMVGIGVAHFVAPDGFASIVPPSLPSPRLLVFVSGFFEILGGLGLVVPRVRRAASFGLVALYVAVFPANVHMALAGLPIRDWHPPPVLLWLRLPLQGLLIVWALWVGKSDGAAPHRP